MFLFGGNNYKKTVLRTDPYDARTESYAPLFALNLKTFAWQNVRTRGDAVKPRDEHTAVIDEANGTMIVFGGFEDGERTNETILYNMKNNMW